MIKIHRKLVVETPLVPHPLSEGRPPGQEVEEEAPAKEEEKGEAGEADDVASQEGSEAKQPGEADSAAPHEPEQQQAEPPSPVVPAEGEPAAAMTTTTGQV